MMLKGPGRQGWRDVEQGSQLMKGHLAILKSLPFTSSEMECLGRLLSRGVTLTDLCSTGLLRQLCKGGWRRVEDHVSKGMIFLEQHSWILSSPFL